MTPLKHCRGVCTALAIVLLTGSILPAQDKADNDGRTPLLAAAFFGHEAAVRALLELGADKDKADNGGETPLKAAARNGHDAVVRALRG